MIGKPVRNSYHGREGFTLVEVLAALAIGSVIIISTAALTWNVAFHFDRGTRAVSDTERLILVANRLAADFGSARYLIRSSKTGLMNTFSGTPTKVSFVTRGGVSPDPQGEEIVSLTVEEGEAGTARLVRRRAAWLGLRTLMETATLQEDVTLFEGKFDIAFAFGRYEPNQSLVRLNSWIGQMTLPHLVWVALRDRKNGVDLFRGTAFRIRADAPVACAKPDAKVSCLTVAASTSTVAPAPPRTSDGK